MAGLYLASVALVTVLTLLLAAQPASAGRGRVQRFLALVAAWLVLVGVMWPATRLTLDLVFIFASQAATLLATGAWLVGSLQRGRAAGTGAGVTNTGRDTEVDLLEAGEHVAARDGSRTRDGLGRSMDTGKEGGL